EAPASSNDGDLDTITIRALVMAVTMLSAKKSSLPAGSAGKAGMGTGADDGSTGAGTRVAGVSEGRTPGARAVGPKTEAGSSDTLAPLAQALVVQAAQVMMKKDGCMM
ncbi:hypothetical protein KEM55_002796, partial [Ascosphaera atra]